MTTTQRVTSAVNKQNVATVSPTKQSAAIYATKPAELSFLLRQVRHNPHFV